LFTIAPLGLKTACIRAMPDTWAVPLLGPAAG
jgi:hypothetical protein